MKLKKVFACIFSIVLCCQFLTVPEYNSKIFNNGITVCAYSTRIYKVNTNSGLKVKTEPILDYDTSWYDTATNETVFEVTEINGDWGYTPSIQCNNSVQSGWLYLPYCYQISSNSTSSNFVTGDWHVSTPSGVKVRSGPSSSDSRVDGGSGAPNGTSFTVVEVSGEWGRTESIYTAGLDGYASGWVPLKYCTLDREYNPNPPPEINPTFANIDLVGGKEVYSVGEAVNFSFSSDGIGSFTIGIDDELNGVRKITQDVGPTFSVADLPAGMYSAYVTAGGTSSYKDSGRVYFTIEDTQNLGDSFDAIVLLKSPWAPIRDTGENVVMAPETGVTNEVWRFKRLSDGSYSICNFATGKYLDAYASGTTHGTNVITAVNSEITPNQRWIISKTSDGLYHLRPSYTSLMLEASNGSIVEDKCANVQLWDREWNGANQTFAIYTEGNPGKPRTPDISLDKTTTNSATISWSKTIYCDSYIIHRSEDKENWKTIDDTKELTYTDNNLKDDKVYYYRVCGTNKFYADGGDCSGFVSAKTEALPKHTIFFDANGGKCEKESQIVKEGLDYGSEDAGGSLPVPTREDDYSKFLGWFTDPLKGDKITNDTKFTLDKDQTLYAHWVSPDTGSLPLENKDNSLLWNEDTWSFNNIAKNFHNNYNISDEALKKWLYEKSLNVDEPEITNRMNSSWSGSCYGMSAIISLAKLGLISADEMGEGYVNISQLGIPKENVKVEDVISFFHMCQYTKFFRDNQQKFITTLETNAKRVDKLIETASKVKSGNPPAVVCFNYTNPMDKNNCSQGHAVVAYGVEYGEWDIAKGYNCRILIYDPNNTEFKDDCCIYINTENYHWVIPRYDTKSMGGCHNENTQKAKETKARITFIVDSVSLLDLFNLTQNISSPLKAETSSTINVLNEDGKVNVSYYNEEGGFQGAECELEFLGDFSGLGSGYLSAALPEADVAYTYYNNQKQDFSVSVCYTNSRLSADVTNGTGTLFIPDESIMFRGSNSDYELSVIFNDGYCKTDWYKISALGINSDEAEIKAVDGGYILTGDSLSSGISILAKNNQTSALKHFKTDSDTVFIYEIDEHTLGIKEDKDGDGVFETEISGDVLSADLKTLNKYIVKADTMTKYDSAKNDTEVDGQLNVLDALKIKSSKMKK